MNVMGKLTIVVVLSIFAGIPGYSSLLNGNGGFARRNASPQEPQKETAPPPNLENIRSHSQSHVTVMSASGPVEVYLYARDQETSILQAPYCGGSAGDKDFQGDFELISVRNGKIVSQLHLNRGTFFVTGHAHDGLRLFTLPRAGGQLVKLYQYGSCNNESVEFYRVAPEGELAKVAFLTMDGRRFPSQLAGPDGEIRFSAQGESVFCNYNNFIAMTLCDAYRYDGKDFVQTESWMGADMPVDSEHPTPTAKAQRALYEFLSALASKDYQTASFYYAGPLPSQMKAGPASAQRSKWLEGYCRAAGCPIPEEFSKPVGSGNEMEFTVSFVTPDFTSFQTNGRLKFHFRVRRLASGFKVLDLPPRTSPSVRHGN